MAVKFKLSSAAERVKTGYEPYDGPEISKAGVYRAVLKSLKYEKKSSDNLGFGIVFELEAAPGDPKGHAEFDGAPFFSRTIVTSMADGSALKEGSQNNLDNFLNALGVKPNPDVVCADGDVNDAPIVVQKIGGKNPIGTAVNLEIQMRMYNGESRAEVASIFAVKEDVKKATKAAPLPKSGDDEDEEDESDLLDMDEASEEEEIDEEEREEELSGMALKALREIAEEYEIDIKGLKKAQLIEAIVEYEFSEEDEDEDEEEPEDDEDDVEEEDDDTEEEDDEEEDEEEEDEQDVRREELSELTRVKLKKIVKDLDGTFRIGTKTTDEQIIDKIVELEFELPF